MSWHQLGRVAQRRRLTIDGTNYQKAAGTGDALTSGSIDTFGYDGVLIVGANNAFSAGATIAVQVNRSTDNSTWAAISAGVASLVAADAQKLWVIDIYRPGQRYLQVVQTRAGGANAAIDSLVAFLYKAEEAAITADASETHTVELNNP